MSLRLNLFIWVFLAYVGISLFFIFQLGLTEQEAYYWLWAKNLDWGYFEHPPLQAWVTSFSTFLFGDEKWVVRLPAFFGNLATLGIFYRWVQTKWDQKTAELCAFLLLSSVTFTMGSVIALPDSLAVPLGLGTMLYAAKAQTRRAGLLLGLALLAKWTVVFMIPGLIYEFYRKNLLHWKEMLPVALITLSLQAPVIWWNYQHQWVSFRFHLYERHAHEWHSFSTYLENSARFFLSQSFSLGLVTTVLILLIFILIKNGQFEIKSAVQWRSVAAWTLPGLLMVFVSAVQGQLRFYWTFLSLLPLVAMSAYLAVRCFPERFLAIRNATIAVILLHWTCAIVAGFYPVGSFIEDLFLLKTDLRHSPMGEFSGWQQWYDETVLPSGLVTKKTALIGSDLHVAARFAWTIRKYKDLRAIGVAGTEINEFQLWPQPELPQYTQAIFFGDNRYDRLSNFDGDCAHAVEWKISSSTVLNHPIKNIYWGFCDQLSPRNFN